MVPLAKVPSYKQARRPSYQAEGYRPDAKFSRH
jgi:hypothetical protein